MMTETDKSIVLSTLPLKNSVLFPHLIMPLAVGRAGSVAAVEAAVASEDKTLAVIKRMDCSNEMVHVIVQGMHRIKLQSVEATDPYLKVQVWPLPEACGEGTEIEALHREVLDVGLKIFKLLQPEAQLGLSEMMKNISDPLHQAYLLVSPMGLDLEKEQSLLAANTRAAGLRMAHEYLTHELEVQQLRHKIASQAHTEMTRQQREYLLRQQLRAIQEELGEKDSEQADVPELRSRLAEADVPETVRKEAEKELARLERMPAAADYRVTRTYLDLVLELPWKKATEDRLDLERARKVLDEDHFDLKDVKERIIEHLAVMKLNPKAKAPILCFVGPPGVGKTSLGQSIARALGRKFERLSLGGMYDEAELRGHRRTYIGAMPGRILQAVRRAGVMNSLLMLDEVDKLGRDFRGDPAAALMEILDPAQNFEFHDNYLDLPKVFFITTANTLDTIPRALLDRMETLRLPGYSDEEKKEIARRYLIPRRLSEAGLTPEQLTLADQTLHQVIRRYTREAGVRELERMLGTISRKVAIRFVEGPAEPDDLPDMLGPQRFLPETLRRHLAPGVAAGLAWTESGGDVLYVEAVLRPEGGQLLLTGQLGDVMQESAKAAQSYILSQAAALGIDRNQFAKTGVHIHVPAGATPKDGPSAGVTMATVLASLYRQCPARSDTAMTGEITLSGLVLPVGGIKEKVLAAHRAGIRCVILPRENEKDLGELPERLSATAAA